MNRIFVVFLSFWVFFCVFSVAPSNLYAVSLEWKPGDESVTIYLPENGIVPGEEVTLDGREGVFRALNPESGIVKLEFNGNIEHFQAEPKVFTGTSNPLLQ